MSSVYVEPKSDANFKSDMMFDFNDVLDNFEKLVGEPLLVYKECEEALEKYINRELTDDEKDKLKNVVECVQERMFYMRQEMVEMDDQMYEEWYNWRINCNYHSYDNYPIKEQINIWENFKRYYDTIQLCESDDESEWDVYEEDYDY